MLTEQRRRLSDREIGPREVVGKTSQIDLAQRGVIDLLFEPLGISLRISENLGDIKNRSAWNATGIELGDHKRRGAIPPSRFRQPYRARPCW